MQRGRRPEAGGAFAPRASAQGSGPGRRLAARRPGRQRRVRGRRGDALDVELRRRSGDAARVPLGRGAYHDPSSGSQNLGTNHIGTRSCVRQSKFFRMYESGNATKALLGQQSLQWSLEEKEGAYRGPVFDACAGRDAPARRREAQGPGGQAVGTGPCPCAAAPPPQQGAGAAGSASRGTAARWATSNSCYGAGAPAR
ncbi:unnamed protein product [Prorocentrum cordatum]|uniref:Uncharacterized protein n=1 Tax=Prorocentrum cordatum TaxID=2364126 RepID=A0ABN9T1R8_9DINO|nr:unnamed protein product [Polarella glacialis]